MSHWVETIEYAAQGLTFEAYAAIPEGVGPHPVMVTRATHAFDVLEARLREWGFTHD